MIKIIKFSLLFLLLTLFYSFIGEKIQKKVIRDANFDTHFYVFIEEKKTSRDAFYFWYKSGVIHESYGDAAGNLLHSEYTQYYSGNQLAEKGVFNYGLKVGLWRKWHPNGHLKEEVLWRGGKKNGDYLYYDQEGKLFITGQYKSDVKSGIWIDILEKDTTWYRKGVAYKEHPRIIKKRLDSIEGKESLFKQIFTKKDSTEIKNIRKPFFIEIFSKKKDSIPSEAKKRPLLKRWFANKKDTLN